MRRHAAIAMAIALMGACTVPNENYLSEDAGGDPLALDSAPSRDVAEAEMQVPTPRDNPYYAPDQMKALTLAPFTEGWEQSLDGPTVFYEELGRAEHQGVTIIAGVFVSLSHTVTAPSGDQVTVPWVQVGWLCLPKQPDFAAANAIGKAAMYNVHDAEAPLDIAGFASLCVQVPTQFKIPLLLHGWHREVVWSVYQTTFHDSQTSQILSLLDAIRDHDIRTLDDLTRVSGGTRPSGLILAKADMVAITLLQRLAAQEAGINVKKVMAAGNSKEGNATWTVASVDDRVEVAAPSGYFKQDDRSLYSRYIKDWNCSVDTIIPQHRSIFEATLKLADWQLTTEAGRFVTEKNSMLNWPLYPKHILIGGDTGRTGCHDHAWPVMAENDFLKQFVHPSWRYARFYDGPGCYGSMWWSYIAHGIDLLVGGPALPSTPTLTVTGDGIDQPCQDADGCLVLIQSSAMLEPGHYTEFELHYLFSSDRNRRKLPFSDNWQKQSQGFTPAASAEMTFELTVPQGEMVTYIVQVRQLAERGTLQFWKASSAIPGEAFPLPEHQCELPSWEQP